MLARSMAREFAFAFTPTLTFKQPSALIDFGKRTLVRLASTDSLGSKPPFDAEGTNDSSADFSDSQSITGKQRFRPKAEILPADLMLQS